MKYLLFPFFIFLVALTTQAQLKSSAISPPIDSILSEIKTFQKAESKKDSTAGHPLGSFKEEDFLRRYNFYVAEKQKLDTINSNGLSFEDQINKEFIQDLPACRARSLQQKKKQKIIY